MIKFSNKERARQIYENDALESQKGFLPRIGVFYRIPRSEKLVIYSGETISTIDKINREIVKSSEKTLDSLFENPLHFNTEWSIIPREGNPNSMIYCNVGTKEQYYDSSANDTVMAMEAVNELGRNLLRGIKNSHLKMKPAYFFANYPFEKGDLGVEELEKGVGNKRFEESLGQLGIYKKFFQNS